MRFVKKYFLILLLGLIFLVLIVFTITIYQYLKIENLKDEKTHLIKEREELKATLASTTIALQSATTTISLLEEEITNLEYDKNKLTENLRDEKDKNNNFEEQIKDIAGTVGVLDKLSKTDKELLKKYSKVYFLNEHYVPDNLKPIDDEYKYDENREFFLHGKVIPFFEKMVRAAKKDGIDLWVVSAYRSFDQQEELKGVYSITYGNGANAFSADQGYSEHQLGTTIDFTTKGIGGGLDGFDSTPAYEWLVKNAYKYGFTLSYPENNNYYIFEPWHWRFVGVDLATDLHRANAHFYDWEQRKIDEYLISIFD